MNKLTHMKCQFCSLHLTKESYTETEQTMEDTCIPSNTERFSYTDPV